MQLIARFHAPLKKRFALGRPRLLLASAMFFATVTEKRGILKTKQEISSKVSIRADFATLLCPKQQMAAADELFTPCPRMAKTRCYCCCCCCAVRETHFRSRFSIKSSNQTSANVFIIFLLLSSSSWRGAPLLLPLSYTPLPACDNPSPESL